MNEEPIKKPTFCKQEIECEIGKLENLVKQNNLDKIKEIIYLAIDYTNTTDPYWMWSSQDAVTRALRVATSLNLIEIVEFFLRVKVSPSTIILAIEAQSLSMVKLLVQYGAEIREESGRMYDMPLIGNNYPIGRALSLGNEEIVQYLLSEGASAKGYFQETILASAETYLAYSARKSYDLTLKALIQRLEYWCDILILPPNKECEEFAFIKHKLKGRDTIILIQGQQRLFFADWSERNIKEIVLKPEDTLHLGSLHSGPSHKLANKNQLKWISEATGIRNDGLGLAIERSIRGAHDKYITRVKKVENSLTQYYTEKSKLQVQYTDPQKIYEQLSRTYKLQNLERLEKKVKQAKAKYEKIVRILMDYATGYDFHSEFLSFFNPLDDVSEINFIGVSINGIPISCEMLKEAKLSGYERAFVTMQDWYNLREASSQKQANIKERVLHNPYFYSPPDNTALGNNFNFAPLYKAAQIGDINAVKIRLSQGVNPNESFLGHKQPIEYAVVNGHESIVEELIKHPDFNTDMVRPALMLSKKHKHKKIEDLLREFGDKIGNINSLDSSGNAKLHYAIESGDIKEVSRLIDMGADVNLKGKLGYPLYICVRKSRFMSHIGYCIKKELPPEYSMVQVNILQLLLEKGANPNISAKDSLLHYVEVLDLLKILLPICDKKDITLYDYRERTEERFPWYIPIMFDTFKSPEWFDILKLLLQENADLNAYSGIGNTLLHLVAETIPSASQIYQSMCQTRQNILGCEDRVKSAFSNTYISSIQKSQSEYIKSLKQLDFLLNHGINPSLRNKSQEDPIPHFILKNSNLSHIVNGYARIIDLFLSKGFDINEKDSNGYTLLHIAASQGDLETVKYLLARGAFVNSIDNWGRSPIYYAAAGSQSRCYPDANPLTTKYLVEYGKAQVDILDKEGLTPLQFSQKIYNEVKQTNDYRDRPAKDKKEWCNSFLNAQEALKYVIRKDRPVQLTPNDYSYEMKSYLSNINSNLSIKALLTNSLLSKEKRKLFEIYRDAVSGEFMDIPVKLNGRIYNLNTLTHLHKNDPITGKPFTRSEIQPAQEVASEILDLLEFFKITTNTSSKGLYPNFIVPNAETKEVQVEDTKLSVNSMNLLPKQNELPDQLLIKIKQLGFEGYNQVKGDGNCLFYAIIDQCQQRNIPLDNLIKSRTNKTDMTSELRQKIAEYITQHSDKYKDYFPIDQYQSLTDFTSKVVISNTYAGQMEITILSQLLVTDIAVIRQDGVLTLIENENSTQSLYLGLVDHGNMSLLNHYYSVIGKPIQPLSLKNKVINPQITKDDEKTKMNTSGSDSGLESKFVQGSAVPAMQGNPNNFFVPKTNEPVILEMGTGKYVEPTIQLESGLMSFDK